MTRLAGSGTALIALVFLLSWTPATLAHSIGESYLFLKIKDGGLGGQVDIPLTKVGDILFADQVNDGIVTQQELDANIRRLQAYIAQRVEVQVSGETLPMRFSKYSLLTGEGVPFAQVFFELDDVPKLSSVG